MALGPHGPLLRPSELARFWELHPKTVYLWIREGRLAAVRTPGSQFRLRAADVRAFCVGYAYPMPPFAGARTRRAHVAGSGVALRTLRRALRDADVEVDAFERTIEALFAAVTEPPALLAIDASAGGVDLDDALRALRRTKRTEGTPVLVFHVATAAKAEALVRAGATHALARGRERELPKAIASMLDDDR